MKTVALFVTCLNDTMFPETGKATVALLERLGYRVVFPPDQTCCGQMHLNSGYRRQAAPIMRRFADAFGPYDTVVTPSGSCAATVRHLLPGAAEALGDAALVEDLVALAPRVFELSQFLCDVAGVEDIGASFPHRVTYHPTCHSLRLLGLGDRPKRLLRQVHGLRLIELPAADECCGFGGTFALKNAETSIAMCGTKVSHVTGTGAEILCATDNSCLANIGGMLSRHRSGVRVMHLAEILASTGASPS